ncbi:MAG: ABC transporter substrate-binding protein [Bifidobacteriaceae bacterium]|jgi:raffinose/stachyose/melibiose transport system substrate-binding protein|nr:ABC transporter substrate-binding protein [Bifidobacteriaceae bacterium]
MKKKLRAVVCAISTLALSTGILSACGNSASGSEGSVYYLNRKVEDLDTWVELGKMYQDQTGVQVKVTSGGTDYDATLHSELAKKNAPTIYTLDGPGMQTTWEKYEADLSDTDVYNQLTDNYKGNALQNKEGKPVGIPFAVESYGIIYNKAILQKYFDASWSSIKSVDDINSYTSLRTVADEIQAHKADLGVKGAFSSAGLDASSVWRYYFHMPATSLSYEMTERNLPMSKVAPSIKGTYIKENLKNLFDMYLTDSTVSAKTVTGKTIDDSVAEFATGQAAFFQNGVWAYSQIKGQSVADKDLGVLPIYIGAKGEENQGLNQVMSNYWAINSKASSASQKASEKFLNWLVTNKEAKKLIVDKMGMDAPFKGFDGEDYQVNNPLANANREYQKAGKKNVQTPFTPSHKFEEELTSDLVNYAQGTGDWNAVINTYTNTWAKEYKANYE